MMNEKLERAAAQLLRLAEMMWHLSSVGAEAWGRYSHRYQSEAGQLALEAQSLGVRLGIRKPPHDDSQDANRMWAIWQHLANSHGVVPHSETWMVRGYVIDIQSVDNTVAGRDIESRRHAIAMREVANAISRFVSSRTVNALPMPPSPSARRLMVALDLLAKHADWSDVKIAAAAGYEGSSHLSRNKTYQKARASLRQQSPPPKGSKHNGQIEASDE